MFRLMNKLSLVVFYFVMIYPVSGGADDSSTNRGIRLYETGKFEAAAEALRDHVKSNPDDAEALRILTLSYIELEEDKEAVEAAEALLEVDSECAEYQYTASMAYGLRAQKAGMLKKAGFAKKMKTAVETAIALDPDHLMARQVLMQFHLHAPGIMGGDKAEAYRQAEAIKSRNRMRGYHVLAMCYMKDERFEDAEKSYQTSISEMPDSVAHYFWYHNWLAGRDRLDESVDVLQQALTVDSSLTQAWIQIGAVSLLQEAYLTAFNAFESALKLEPDSRTALYQMGKVAAVSGQFGDKALRALDQFDALPDLEVTNLAWSQIRRGQILEHLNRMEEAKIAFERALSMDKKNKTAQEALEKLKGD